ncbi:hypothetical protein QAD02_011983, partial [Eretmocerus hayati]
FGHDEIEHKIQQRELSKSTEKPQGRKIDEPRQSSSRRVPKDPSSLTQVPFCQPSISAIPDSLSPQERKILEAQVQHNKKNAALMAEWSKANSVDRILGLRQYQENFGAYDNARHEDPNPPQNEAVRRSRLQRRKEELINEYNRLRDYFTYSEPSVQNRFDAGPNNGESD